MSSSGNRLSLGRIVLFTLLALGVLIGSLLLFPYIRALLLSPRATTSPSSFASAMFGGNAQRTHFNSDEHILTPSTVSRLMPDWSSLPTGGSIFSSPAVVNGVVYVGSDDGKLYAFAANGCGKAACEPLWTSPITGDALYSSPVVADGVVYIGSLDHKLYSYSLR